MIYLPFILQGIVMTIDEFLIHEKRGLPRWERLGHPLDSLTALAVFLFALNFPWSRENELVYLGLSVFSCLFITKDEFVHKKESSAFEHWLHALLFILHPVVFGATWLVWKKDAHHPFLLVQTLVVFFFMLYQILRWSELWPRLTTRSTKPSASAGTKPGMIPSPSSGPKGN